MAEPVYEPEDVSKRGVLDLDVYDVPELANRLGLHKTTLHAAIRNGQLRALKVGGQAGYRILQAWVLEWLSGVHREVKAEQERVAGG